MVTTSLSSIKSPSLSTTLNNVGLKQFKRTLLGNVSINFSECLNKTVDLGTNNYTNFYLTSNLHLDNLITVQNEPFLASNIKTYLKYGNSYLQFSPANENAYKLADRYKERVNYGECTFSENENDSTKFNFEVLDNNNCRLYFFYNYKKYYLCVSDTNKVSFVLERLIPTSGTVNPHDFNYMFSETSNSILLFKKTATDDWIVTKSGNTLQLINNIVNSISVPFQLSRSIYTTLDTPINTNIVSYTNDNKINLEHQVKNNVLLHKPVNSPLASLIVLKNQLDQYDTFTYGNSLLSSGTILEYCDGVREYTSLFSDITEEKTDELELNYVTYNKNYIIKPGKTEFIAPSSMYPYLKMNVNDSTFRYSGSFSYLTPEYSDKIFSKYVEPNLDNQHLLCTWLSGHPNSENSIWVDRYYYPDVITKEDAISFYAPANATYLSDIEQLLQGNISLRDDVEVKKVFDKLSDMVFEPNRVYVYDRISTTVLPSLTSNINYCFNNLNYFNMINDEQKFSVGFYFAGSGNDWVIKSASNDQNTKLEFTKVGNIITIEYKLFDSSSSTVKNWTVSTTIKDYKENFVMCSVNGITGKGYFFLNNDIILNFTIPKYQFTYKKLLYSDFYLYENNIVIPLLQGSTNITLPFVTNDYTDEHLSFIRPILNGKQVIDDIYISLPCGMRNGSDNIEYLQNIGGSAISKSSNFDILIKNTNLTNSSILSGIQDTILNNLNSIPAVSDINNIKFENYK